VLEVYRPWRRSEESQGCKVSVVVPVYNPGEHINDLIRSLDEQSMPKDSFEVIFVDDGSTDGTGELLDELAQTRPNRVVRHIPNSRWPGKPRNVGLDLARGEYVAFVDHDDYLGTHGLEKVYAFAKKHDSDVVIAREVGVGRNIGWFMFARTVPNARLGRHPVLRLLTPHKVYRRALLQEHGIRFPEGKVRLEDHLFNVKVYFAAKRISIYSGYPYYYWTKRAGVSHASGSKTNPREYFDEGIGRVLDVVEDNTEPGRLRDKLKSHWLEYKMLPPLGGAAMLRHTPEYRQELYTTVRRLVLDRFPEGTDRHMGWSARKRAHLLRAGRLDELVALAGIDQDVTASVRTQQVRWRGRQARVRLEIALVYRDGSPVEFRRAGRRLVWVVPSGHLPEDTFPNALLGVAKQLLRARATVYVKRRDAPKDFHVVPRGGFVLRRASPGRWRVVFRGEARIDVQSLLDLAAGDRKSVVDLGADLTVLGWRGRRRVPAPDDLGQPLALPGNEGLARLYTTKFGNLSIEVDPTGR
jgi:poly(ribitol-phosphate) beta-N-acetylglucosaminyltransferase